MNTKPNARVSEKAKLIRLLAAIAEPGPLRFFSLMVVVIEGILGGIAFLLPAPERYALARSMVNLLALLIVAVVLLALVRPGTLQSPRKGRKSSKTAIAKSSRPSS